MAATLSYQDEMAVVHRIVRRELALLPPLVRTVADGDRRRAETIGAWAAHVLEWLHHHHEGEDELLWPLLRERLGGDPAALALVDRMSGQHSDLADALAGARDAVARWRSSAAASDRDAVADAMDTMREPTLEHLDQEEAELCPLAEQHVSLREWRRLGEHGRKAMTMSQGMDTFGAMLEYASPSERANLIGQMPPPLRPLVKPVIERRYRRRMAAVRGA